MISDILIVMAMEAEAAPLLDSLDARPAATGSVLPTKVFEAQLAATSIRVAVNGPDREHGVDSIGTVAAALSTHDVLTARRADLVISAGTAGGWDRQGTEVGDVFSAWDRFVFHDRRIPLPGFEHYGVGDLPAADLREPAQAVGCKLGVITTGDSLDESDADRAQILASGAAVKEMEGAAVARVASMHGVPVTAIKAITDLVDDPAPTEEQFVANLTTASQRLQSVLLELLPRLDGYVL